MKIMSYFQKILTLVVLFAVCSRVRGNPDVTILYTACSYSTYDLNDPYRITMKTVLIDLVQMTPKMGYNYYEKSPWVGTPVYGHGACNGVLSYVDCGQCMSTAFTNVLNICPYRIGGQVQLQDCRIRYENYSFVDES